MTDDEDVSEARFAAHYPLADITPAEFEVFVAELLGSMISQVEGLEVSSHEVVAGVDGSYDFDATVRFNLGGMAFLVVVEAKRYKDRVKRDNVQVLHSKATSVGAQKAILFSTSHFQRGAIEYAKRHGIALVFVTEGRFTYETRAAFPTPALNREDAMSLLGIPAFVGIHIGPGVSDGSTTFSLIDVRDPERVAGTLLPSPGA